MWGGRPGRCAVARARLVSGAQDAVRSSAPISFRRPGRCAVLNDAVWHCMARCVNANYPRQVAPQDGVRSEKQSREYTGWSDVYSGGEGEIETVH